MPGVKALINIIVKPKELDAVTNKLLSLPEVVDLYEVTGEYDIVALVSTNNIVEFREFLRNKVLKIKGVEMTNTSVIIFVHKREGKIVEG